MPNENSVSKRFECSIRVFLFRELTNDLKVFKF